MAILEKDPRIDRYSWLRKKGISLSIEMPLKEGVRYQVGDKKEQ